MSKTKTLEWHTGRRLKERYGLKYSQFLQEDLLKQMRAGKAKLVFKQSLRVTIFDATYQVRAADIYDVNSAKVGPVVIRFAYDKSRKTIITVLTLDMNPAISDIYDESI